MQEDRANQETLESINLLRLKPAPNNDGDIVSLLRFADRAYSRVKTLDRDAEGVSRSG